MLACLLCSLGSTAGCVSLCQPASHVCAEGTPHLITPSSTHPVSHFLCPCYFTWLGISFVANLCLHASSTNLPLLKVIASLYNCWRQHGQPSGDINLVDVLYRHLNPMRHTAPVFAACLAPAMPPNSIQHQTATWHCYAQAWLGATLLSTISRYPVFCMRRSACAICSAKQ